MRPSRAERRFIFALLDGEELKTTAQAYSRVRTQCYRKGFVKWRERGRGELLSGCDSVTDGGLEAVGRAR